MAILALSVLIIVHEAGHYVCAKLGGMHVDVFSVIGIGPVVLHLFEWRGTKFVISAIPFGAYVHIVGMEPDEEELDEAGKAHAAAEAEKAREMGYQNYRERPAWARALALAGGPGANYLVAFLLAFTAYASAGLPNAASIAGFGPASPARAACLKEGDVLVSIAGKDVTGSNPRGRVIETCTAHLGETVPVVVDRHGEKVSRDVRLNDAAPALSADLKEEFVSGASLPAVFVAAAIYPFETTVVQLGGLAKMVTGQAKGRVGGPVAIVKAMKSSADQGWANFILFGALISTVLGMFNLLPLPALDGGRLLFLGWEVIVRRPVSAVIEAWVHGIGLLALFALLIYATVGDIRGEPQRSFVRWHAEYKLRLDDIASQRDAASRCSQLPEPSA